MSKALRLYWFAAPEGSCEVCTPGIYIANWNRIDFEVLSSQY